MRTDPLIIITTSLTKLTDLYRVKFDANYYE